MSNDTPIRIGLSHVYIDEQISNDLHSIVITHSSMGGISAIDCLSIPTSEQAKQLVAFFSKYIRN